MSNRERWIVYPLLFLSMGIGLGGKMYSWSPMLQADKIQCRELVVVGDDGSHHVVLRSTDSGGVVSTFRADHKLQLAFGHEGRTSSLFVETPAGDEQSWLSFAALGNLQHAADGQQLYWLPEMPVLKPALRRPK